MPDNTVSLTIKATDEASATLTSIQNKLLGLASGYISFKGFEDLVSVINEAQVATLEFDHAFQEFGGHVQYSRQQLEDWAASAANSTTIARTSILSGEAELLKYGQITGDTFDKARQVMLDMAARTGDAAEAARRLGVIMENPIAGYRMLREVGIVFTQQQREQITMLVQQGQQQEVVNYLLDQYQKRVLDATAYTETLSGAMQQVKNAFAEAFQGAEQGPNKLVEAIHGLRDTLRDPAVKEGFQELAEGATTAFGFLAEAIAGVARRVHDAASEFALLKQEAQINQMIMNLMAGHDQTHTYSPQELAALRQNINIAWAANDSIRQDIAKRNAAAAYSGPSVEEAAGSALGMGHLFTGGTPGSGNDSLRTPFGWNFVRPNQLGYAAGNADYNQDLVKRIIGWPDSTEIAKFVAADKVSMDDASSAWADYTNKVASLGQNQLITAEARNERAQYLNEQWLKSTQTDTEKILQAYTDFQRMLNKQVAEGLDPDEGAKRMHEYFEKMTAVTRTDAENAVITLHNQLKQISDLPGGDQGGGAEAMQKFFQSVQGTGSQLLDPLEQATIQFNNLEIALVNWRKAAQEGLVGSPKDSQEAQLYADTLKMIGVYMERLPQQARLASTQVGQAQAQLVGALQNSFAGFFNNTHEGLRGFVLDFTNAFKQILAQAAAMDLIDALGLGSYVGRPSSGGGFVAALVSAMFGGGGGSNTVSSADWADALAGLGTVAPIFGAAGGGPISANQPVLVGEAGAELWWPDSSGQIVPNNKLGGSRNSVTYAPVTNISGTGLSAEQLTAVIAVNNNNQRRELYRTMERNGLGRMR